MSVFALVILAALLPSSSAQVPVGHVWSAVAYLFHGERTPSQLSTSRSLTPLGAQQMFAQGSIFRSRYIDNGSSGADQNITQVLIEGIEANAMDASQLSILTTDDHYTSASAFAFLQALYPPTTETFARGAGGIGAAELANGSIVDYPLDGYQYPDINVLSAQDPDSVWIEGHVACAEYQESRLLLAHEPMVDQIYQRSLAFYRDLWGKIFSDAFPLNATHFYNAYDLYEYASYKYNHDNKTHAEITETDLARLEVFASTQQRYLNGNPQVPGLAPGDTLRTIAGRMLAAKILAQLRLNMQSSGSSKKLNLMFGSFEPFVAFFAVSRLANGASADNFEPLPSPGAAMVFELFSTDASSSSYPSTDDLWVRFLYRDNNLAGAPFVEYSLFGYGNSQSRIKFSDFATAMEAVSVASVAQWCNVCDSLSLFCAALAENSSGGTAPPPQAAKQRRRGVSPAVAGVIGALVATAVLGLAAAAAALAGGVRIYRADRGRRRGAALSGGFKGAEKKASDADVAHARSGARHERTGSWELRAGGTGAGAGEGESVATTTRAGAVVGAPERASSRASSRAAREGDDDDVSVMGHTPVTPRESV